MNGIHVFSDFKQTDVVFTRVVMTGTYSVVFEGKDPKNLASDEGGGLPQSEKAKEVHVISQPDPEKMTSSSKPAGRGGNYFKPLK